MRNRLEWVPTTLALITLAFVVSPAAGQAPATPTGWILEDDADTRKSPLAADAATLATGKAIYKDKCASCHGPPVSATALTPSLKRGPTWTSPPEAAPAATRRRRLLQSLNGRRRPYKTAFKGYLTEAANLGASPTRSPEEEVAAGADLTGKREHGKERLRSVARVTIFHLHLFLFHVPDTVACDHLAEE